MEPEDAKPLCDLLLNDSLIMATVKEKKVKATFICEVCHKTFTRKENLQNHMYLHTGNMPYSCTECGKGIDWISLTGFDMLHAVKLPNLEHVTLIGTPWKPFINKLV